MEKCGVLHVDVIIKSDDDKPIVVGQNPVGQFTNEGNVLESADNYNTNKQENHEESLHQEFRIGSSEVGKKSYDQTSGFGCSIPVSQDLTDHAPVDDSHSSMSHLALCDNDGHATQTTSQCEATPVMSDTVKHSLGDPHSLPTFQQSQIDHEKSACRDQSNEGSSDESNDGSSDQSNEGSSDVPQEEGNSDALQNQSMSECSKQDKELPKQSIAIVGVKASVKNEFPPQTGKKSDEIGHPLLVKESACLSPKNEKNRELKNTPEAEQALVNKESKPSEIAALIEPDSDFADTGRTAKEDDKRESSISDKNVEYNCREEEQCIQSVEPEDDNSPNLAPSNRKASTNIEKDVGLEPAVDSPCSSHENNGQVEEPPCKSVNEEAGQLQKKIKASNVQTNVPVGSIEDQRKTLETENKNRFQLIRSNVDSATTAITDSNKSSCNPSTSLTGTRPTRSRKKIRECDVTPIIRTRSRSRSSLENLEKMNNKPKDTAKSSQSNQGQQEPFEPKRIRSSSSNSVLDKKDQNTVKNETIKRGRGRPRKNKKSNDLSKDQGSERVENISHLISPRKLTKVEPIRESHHILKLDNSSSDVAETKNLEGKGRKKQRGVVKRGRPKGYQRKLDAETESDFRQTDSLKMFPDVPSNLEASNESLIPPGDQEPDHEMKPEETTQNEVSHSNLTAADDEINGQTEKPNSKRKLKWNAQRQRRGSAKRQKESSECEVSQEVKGGSSSSIDGPAVDATSSGSAPLITSDIRPPEETTLPVNKPSVQARQLRKGQARPRQRSLKALMRILDKATADAFKVVTEADLIESSSSTDTPGLPAVAEGPAKKGRKRRQVKVDDDDESSRKQKHEADSSTCILTEEQEETTTCIADQSLEQKTDISSLQGLPIGHAEVGTSCPERSQDNFDETGDEDDDDLVDPLLTPNTKEMDYIPDFAVDDVVWASCHIAKIHWPAVITEIIRQSSSRPTCRVIRIAAPQDQTSPSFMCKSRNIQPFSCRKKTQFLAAGIRNPEFKRACDLASDFILKIGLGKVKSYEDYLHQKNGGGGPTGLITEIDSHVLDEESPAIIGISGGANSLATLSSTPNDDLTTADSAFETEAPRACASSSNPATTASTAQRQSGKRGSKDNYNKRLVDVEIQRAQADIERIKLDKERIMLEKVKLELEITKLKLELADRGIQAEV